MSYYVYSTLTSDMKYTIYKDRSTDLPVVERTIFINGGANLADKKNPLVTPKGFVTEISDEDYEALKTNAVFQLHVKNNFVVVEQRSIKLEKVISDLAPRDPSSPKIASDFSESDQPIVGAIEEEAPRGGRNRK
jgi:hypothetical protein